MNLKFQNSKEKFQVDSLNIVRLGVVNIWDPIFWGPFWPTYLLVRPTVSPLPGNPFPEIWGQGGDGESVFRFFGENLGMGRTKFLGIFGDKFPKNPQSLRWGQGQWFWGKLGNPRFSPKSDKCHFILIGLLLSHTPVLSLLSNENCKIYLKIVINFQKIAKKCLK